MPTENIQPGFVNPELLREVIREKERGYINTLVNLFLYPRFIDLCERDIADPECSPERREALENTVASHRMALSGETQSLETWELLIPHLYSLHPDVSCNQD
jgi:hypothetical protein